MEALSHSSLRPIIVQMDDSRLEVLFQLLFLVKRQENKNPATVGGSLLADLWRQLRQFHGSRQPVVHYRAGVFDSFIILHLWRR